MRVWQWMRKLFWWGFGIGLAGVVVLGLMVAVAVKRIPNFENLKQSPVGQTIRVRDADGTVFFTLGPNYGRWLDLKTIPMVMQDAIVAVEDRRFRYHLGADPIGLARAIWLALNNYGSGRRMQGASTITQQLARNLFLSNGYDFGRKAREMVLAFALEWKFSKNQILELYLNKVYFGGGSYGVDAAARRFFGHSATAMTLPEAAIIAGLVKAPSRYAPTANAQAAIARAGVVLDVMVDAGVIARTQSAIAKPADIEFVHESDETNARYFTDWVLPQLDSLIDEGSAALDVYTTIDLTMQRSASNAVHSNVPNGAQGALVSIDRDGAVRAMVGGTDYVKSNYNRATQAVRQPGSAWKLFVYMAALESGYRVDDRMLDGPVTIRGWSPRNNNGRFSGEVSLRTAFSKSINTVAAKLGNDVGFTAVAKMARRLGITTPVNTYPSMVLGTADVRLMDMTLAFASVARRGVSTTPYAITKIVTVDGELLYQRQTKQPRKLVDSWVAAGMTDLLQTAVNSGTGRSAQIGRPVAGKTGTTSSNKDGWFLGFSSGLTTGVWMGRDDAKPVRRLQGGRAPARAFADFMRRAVAKRPVEAFDTKVTLPEWQLEDSQNIYFGAPDSGPLVDANGMPIELPPINEDRNSMDSISEPGREPGSEPDSELDSELDISNQWWVEEQMTFDTDEYNDEYDDEYDDEYNETPPSQNSP